jgi:uncharacterized membrane protein YedE/YeeE
MMESILMATAGGALIGLAVSATLLVSGRIAGISGIVGGLFRQSPTDVAWRTTFIAGLLVGGAVLLALMPEAVASPSGRSLVMVGLAGGLVGFGTRLGNGCTSGHGVCGLSRLSMRSLVATMTFMGTGFATATLLGLFGGGPS